MKTFLVLLTLALGISVHAAESQRAVQSIALPKYPPLAYQARIEGTVRLSVVVDATGKVVKATVISGHGLLQAAACENVKTWHFAPVPSGGPSEIAVAFVFKIEGKEIPYAEPSKQRPRIGACQRL
jgi:TonB family protein